MKLMLGTLHRQVLLTLSYSQVFLKPLSAEEIWTRLLRSSASSQASPEEIGNALDDLKKLKMVSKKGGFWQLNVGDDLSGLRKKRERLSAMKVQELQPFLSFSKWIPWIRGVAITGSVSVNNADAKDDVDLMIITQSGRLWLVRPLLVLFSFIMGKRRSWNREEYNSWCLNLWLDEDTLQVVADKRSVYIAHEVCQARWCISNNGVEAAFLQVNQWVAQYLPNYFAIRTTEAGAMPARSSTYNIFDGWLRFFNTCSYALQRWYMQRHMTTERVGKSYAFFHPRDTRKSIVNQWRQLLTEY